MAKRTSWDQKAKGIHKSRKKIIDTVFGTGDTNKSMFGYEKAGEEKHKIGEVWTDSDGKTWEQKDGFKISVTKFDEIRQYLQKVTTCSAEDCKTTDYAHADKKAIAKTGMCIDCLRRYEQGLRNDGTWPFYEDYKITCNKIGYGTELQQQYETALNDIKNKFEQVNENGTISEWVWDIDIQKVKGDIQTDIDDVKKALKKLKSRKTRLEKKLKELGHPEIIR